MMKVDELTQEQKVVIIASFLELINKWTEAGIDIPSFAATHDPQG